MNKYPTKYTKENIIAELKNNGIRNGIIGRIEKLPNVLHVDDNKFYLNIITSWHNNGDTYYEFEINYYSPKNLEFLFPYKIFNDIEHSLNNIEAELKKGGFIN